MGRPMPVAEGQLFTSVSQLKTYLRCSRLFQLRYVRGLPPDFVPVALAFGTAFHSALGRFYSGMQSSGTAPALELVQQTFRDAWEEKLRGPIPVQGDDGEELAGVVDLGARMLAAFYAHPPSKPVQ